MSLRVMGGAGGSISRIASYTVPATITGISKFAVTSNAPVPVQPVPTNVTTTATKTSYQDNPGMSSVSAKTITSPGQVDALRSAAANTALAFGLDVTISSDRALRLQKQTTQQEFAAPRYIIDTVVIPK